MEGDLLEVFMEETKHLWRILNAAKPGSSDLTLINLRYNIMVSITKQSMWLRISDIVFLIFGPHSPTPPTI